MYRKRNDRARRAVALIIGCGIIAASWIIGCQQSTETGISGKGWLYQILRIVPGTQASSQPEEKKSVAETTGIYAKEIYKKNEELSKMVLIPSTEEGFYMGTSDKIAQKIAWSYEVLFWEDEQPQHRVKLNAYYIDKYEVSNSQYKKFLDATGHDEPKYWKYPNFRQPEQPVIGVTWEDANQYATWANKRLPTEAEWEKAATGIYGYIYPWGNDFNEKELNFDCEIGGTTSVKAFPVGASSYGVLNMAGNVAEWVADWYKPNYYAESQSIDPNRAVRNPLGPATGTDRVYRGGAWNDWQLKNLGVRCAKRYHAPPETQLANLGFRCAMDARKAERYK